MRAVDYNELIKFLIEIERNYYRKYQNAKNSHDKKYNFYAFQTTASVRREVREKFKGEDEFTF